MPSAAALDLIINLKDKASDGLDSLSDTVGGFGKVLGLAGAGVVAFGGILAGAAKAASDEQVGIDRLGATLKANIPNFKGNEKAAEGFVTSMEALAFTDDEARDSLNALIPRTHDLTEAQKLSTLAADLARAKNIDLTTATQIVGKVYGGNVGILGRYGIAVDKGATSTEALAAIQKMAGGQAQTYADSTAGSVDRLQTAFGDAFETIGHSVLDVVSGPLKDFADWLQTPEVQSGIQTVADVIGQGLTGAFNLLKGALDIVGPPIGEIAKKIGEFFAAVASGDKDSVLKFFNDIGGPIGLIGTALTEVATKVGEFFQAVGSGDKDNVIKFWNDIGGPIGFVGKALTDLVDDVGQFFGAVASGDQQNVLDFFNNLGGGPDSLVGQLGFQLVDAYNGITDFFSAANGGGSAEAKQFWIDLKALVEEVIDDWNQFWGPQSDSTKKNAEEWKDIQLNGDPTKNEFTGNWNQFWEDTRTNLGVSKQDWDDFFSFNKTKTDDMKTQHDGFYMGNFDNIIIQGGMLDQFFDDAGKKLGLMQSGWNIFWTFVTDQTTQFSTQWNNYWDMINKGISVITNGWNGFWTFVTAMFNNWKTAWDTFWDSVNSALTNFGSNWDTFWTNLWAKITGLTDSMSNIGGDIVDNIRQGISDAWNGLVNFVRSLLDSLLATIQTVVGSIPGGGGNAPTIANGHGGHGAITSGMGMGRAGGGFGGGMSIGNVNIYATPGTDGGHVAAEFIRGLEEQLGVSVRLRNPSVVHP